MNLPSEYTWDYQVCTYDVGPGSLLKLSIYCAFSRRPVSGISGRRIWPSRSWRKWGWHSSSPGQTFKLNDCQKWESRSGCAPGTGANMARRFPLFSDSGRTGEELVNSVTAYALVDPETKRLLRPKVFLQLGIQSQEDKVSSCPDPERLKLPGQMESAGHWAVRPSDTDWNNHLNNAAYLDILSDFLPQGVGIERLGLVSVCFLSQALVGTTSRFCGCRAAIRFTSGACMSAVSVSRPAQK